MRRSGFALLAVLWVIAGAAIIVFMIGLEVRTAIESGRNRINSERAYWAALGCLMERRAAVDELLASELDEQRRSQFWRDLPRRLSVSISSDDAGCKVSWLARGTTLNVNTATQAQLVTLFAATGLGSGRFDLARAVMNRRPFEDVEQLSFLKEFDGHSVPLKTRIGTDTARVSLDHAPAEVLMTIPGFSPEVVDRVIERRGASYLSVSMIELIDMVSAGSAEQLREHFPEIMRTAVADTEGWLLVVEAESGFPPISSQLRIALVRHGTGAATVRWEVR